MARYVVTRLASGLLTLFLFVTLLFFLVNVVVPGDFTSQFAFLTGPEREALQESLGIDRPLWEQYMTWLGGVLTFNLGTSFGGIPVSSAIAEAMPTTLVVLGVGLSLAFLLGGWVGRATAYRGKGLFSGSMTFIAVVFLTMFPPTMAVLMEKGMKNVFGFRLAGGFGRLEPEVWAVSEMSPGTVMWRMLVVLVVSLGLLWGLDRAFNRIFRRRIPTWLFLIAMVALPLAAWQGMGMGGLAFDLAGVLSILITGVVLLTFGEVVLITRAAMDDVMLEDYVMVARAKGLPDKQVRDHHAARTALLPVLSRFTVAIPYFLTGLIILEAVFGGAGVGGAISILQQTSIPPGMGTLIFEAVRLQDTPLVVGSLLVVGAFTLALRLGLDVTHAALDPRVRFSERSRG